MGGIGGLAEAFVGAKELQGDSTIHAHGFVALANMFQHSTMDDIGKLLISRINNLSESDIVHRVTAFVEHLHREEHFHHDDHQALLPELEKQFHGNNYGLAENIFLSVRPRCFLDSSKNLLTYITMTIYPK